MLFTCCFMPERMRAMAPQACGDAIEVPFMSWVPRSANSPTEVMAPPGAHSVSPRSPSIVGPRELHVNWVPVVIQSFNDHRSKEGRKVLFT